MSLFSKGCMQNRIKQLLRVSVASCILFGAGQPLQAQTYTALPTVVVTGQYTVYWPGGTGTSYVPAFDSAFPGPSNIPGVTPEAIIALQKNLTACLAIGVSSYAKTSRGSDDLINRFLVANELINNAYMRGGGAAISIGAARIDSSTGAKSLITIIYADGMYETWMLIPGWQMMSTKIFDQPLPNSLKGPSNTGCIG